MTFPLFKSFYKLRQFNALNSFFVSSEHTFWENKFSRQEECFSRRKRTNVLSFDPFLSLFCCFSFFCEWCVENVWTRIGPRGKYCAILVSSHVFSHQKISRTKSGQMKNYTMIFSLLLNCCFNWIWFHHTFLFTSCCLVDQLPVTRIFGSKFLWAPPLKYFRNVGLEYPSAPFTSPIPPPHSPINCRKWTFRQDLALWIWSWSGINPSPRMKIWPDWRTLDLCWSWVPTLTLENKNLVRTWYFGFELVWSTSPTPEMKIWSGFGTLDLSWSGLHPPSKMKFGQDLTVWIWVGLEYPLPIGFMWELLCGD